MTDDKDFKRLVRQRMAKTGESYTAARAQLRPQLRSPQSPLKTLYQRTGLDRLGEHLQGRYGIAVRKLTELDVGVFRVDRSDGPAWVARVFPAARAVEQAEADAAVLRAVADHGIPAERCAHDEPVSVMADQALLVTEHVTGVNARTDVSGPTMHSLGSTVGRLHACPLEFDRPAGGWHHISVNGGGVRDDVEALLPMLEGKEFDFVRRQLESVDGCVDLPHALIHPDPCGANAVVTADGTPVLVDWTGAGRGPRILSLASLLAGSIHPMPGAPPGRVLEPIDAIVAGYRAHVRLTDAELARLPAAMAGGWIVLACWMLLFQDVPVREVSRGIADRLNVADRVAARVAEALNKDDEELTGWYAERRPRVDPAQGALF